MKIGVSTEIKPDESRVGLVPSGAEALTGAGHTLAVIAADIWEHAELVVKVKEPQEPEWRAFREDPVLSTFLHLAASETLTDATLPYVQRLADRGWRDACRTDTPLCSALNVVRGHIVHPGVAEAFGRDVRPVEELLKGEAD